MNIALLIAMLAAQSASKGFTFQVNHTVTLTWTASTTPGVSQYNIYRDGSLLGAAPCCQFLDKNVQSGATYMYEATAVLNAVESVKSNQASATIP